MCFATVFNVRFFLHRLFIKNTLASFVSLVESQLKLGVEGIASCAKYRGKDYFIFRKITVLWIAENRTKLLQ